MAYSDKVVDHYNNPRNVGSLPKEDPNVGTGLVGAPECGDVMKLQMRINPETQVIEEARFKTFGCGSAIASSSLATEWVKGKTVAEGTSDQLKQKVAGDVITIGIDGAGANVLTLVEAMPFVREASHDIDSGLVRLYVDRGETAVPHLLRSLDAAGYEPTSISLNKPSLDDVFLRQTGRSLREEAA